MINYIKKKLKKNNKIKVNKLKNNIKENYSSSSIKILGSIEAIRKFPSIYIGDITNGEGLHHLVYELLNNSIDEFLEGYCDSIKLEIFKDNSIIVSDNGRGIPINIKIDDKKDIKRTGAEIILTELYSGGKFNKKNYKISGGLHGIGCCCVNALSKKLILNVFNNNIKYELIFHNGIIFNPIIEIKDNIKISPAKIIGKSKNKNGTLIHFWPDNKIFKNIIFDSDILINRIKELSFINPKINIIFIDHRNKNNLNFKFDKGIVDFIELSNLKKKSIHNNIFYIETYKILSKEKLYINIGLKWIKGENKILCYTNSIPQKDGGTHFNSVMNAITKFINIFIKKNKLIRNNIEILIKDIIENLFCIISIKFSNPKYNSQTKYKLISNEIKKPIENTVLKYLDLFFKNNKSDSLKICNSIINIAKNRIILDKNNKKYKKNNISKLSNIYKLSDCTKNNLNNSELYIVEGDSAGGSAKQARDRNYQAIYPLRGKLLNVEKSSFEKILSSKHIIDLISIIGINIKNKNKIINRINYNKIIIMTDADIDGFHIKTLLLTFFYRYAFDLLKNGYIYIAQPPLYKIEYNKHNYYFSSFIEKIYIYKNIILENFKFLFKYNIKIKEELFETILNENLFIKILIKKLNYKFSKNIILLFSYIDYFPKKFNSINEINIFIKKIKNIAKKINILIIIDINKVKDDYFIFLTEKINNNKKYLLNNIIFNTKFRILIKLYSISKKIIPIIIIEKKTNKYFFYKNLDNCINNLYLLIESYITKQRYKGLGEMNPKQLWETTMNPKTRKLMQLKIKNKEKIDKLLSILMGNEILLRKEFIFFNTYKIQNLNF